MTQFAAGRPAAFLDRDGTITVEKGYVTRPEDVELIAGAARAIRSLNRAGILAVVVSNQSGVGRGLMTEDDLARVHAELERLLALEGARLDAAYYCPEPPPDAPDRGVTSGPACRKPQTGMIDRALRELTIDPEASCVVGDSWTDVELARRAGVPGVLVMTGKGVESLSVVRDRGIPLAYSASDLEDAVRWIVARAARPHGDGGAG